MRLRLRPLGIVLLSALLPWVCGASAQEPVSEPPPDEVFLKNGDKLTGKIVGLSSGKLTIETPYAGKLEIDWEQVATFNAPGGLELVLKSGEQMKAPVTRSEDGSVRLEPSALAAEQLALQSIEHINPKPVAWTGNLAAGVEFKRGNSDEDSATVTGLASRTTELDRITLRARYTSARTKDPVTHDWLTSDRYVGGSGQYDLFFAKSWFAYVIAGAERDRAKFLDARYSAGVGLGWQYADSDDYKGSLEAGLNYISEKYKLYQNHPVPPGTVAPAIRSDEDYLAARVAWTMDWLILENLRYLQYTQYFPSLEDKDKFLVRTEHSLRLSVTGNLFVQSGVIYDYDSQPGSPGAEKLDAKYLIQVGWSF